MSATSAATKKDKVAIIGASYLQLPLVEKARDMGLETHCFAWDTPDAVCRDAADFFYPISVLEKEAILAQCAQIGIAGITTIATDICIPTIAYVAHELGLTANSQDSAFCSTNKAAMRAAFEQAGVSSPKSQKVVAGQTVSVQEYPVIVKPADRSGSRGVTQVNTPQELETAVARALAESISGTAVVEQFIVGAEVSVEAISWQGTHYILAVTDKVTTGAPYFVELEHHQPSALPASVLEKIKHETLKALDALDIRFGASHSEFKIDDQGAVYIIETGARMGGDFIGSALTPLSTGYDFLAGVLQVALGHFETPRTTASHFSGIYYLCADTQEILPFFENRNLFDIKKEILTPELKPINNSNDRSGYLIYQSDHKIQLR